MRRLISFVLVPLFFDFPSQFLKVLSEAAPGAAARDEGESRQNEADALEFVHGEGFNRARNGGMRAI